MSYKKICIECKEIKPAKANSINYVCDACSRWKAHFAPIKSDSTALAVVDSEYHWRPIDESTPRGAKIQLIDKAAGVAFYSIIKTGEETGYTHWAPLPTFA